METDKQQEEIWNALTSSNFTVESGQQLVAIVTGQKVNRKRGNKPEKKVLCLVKRKEKTLEIIGKSVPTIEIVPFDVKEEGEGKKYLEKKRYKLKKLSKIEGGTKDKENEFTLHWGTSYHFVTESVDARNVFLWKLLQLITETFNTSPELINITHLELSFFANSDDASLNSNQEEVFLEQQDLFTMDEEALITRILENYKIDISDSKKLTLILQSEIERMETENIHDILEKQEQWGVVISLLSVAEKQLFYMDSWLSKYNERLEKMRREIEQIEAENNYMETQARNLSNLDSELSKLTNRLDITREVEENLKKSFEENTTEKALKGILDSVSYIENGITGVYQDGMEFMISVQERRKIFIATRLELVKRFKDFLKKNFSKMMVKSVGNEGLQDYTSFYEMMINRYQILMNSVAQADVSILTELAEAYAKNREIIFKKDFAEFFGGVKNIIKKCKENKPFLLGGKDVENQLEVIPTMERMDIKFDQILVQLCNIIHREVEFYKKFFDKNGAMLNKMFKKAIENGFETMITTMKTKMDLAYAISMSCIIQEKIAHFNNDFITIHLKSLDAMMLEIFGKYIEKQVDSIKNYTCAIKKTNVAHFVIKYSQFYNKMDEVLRDPHGNPDENGEEKTDVKKLNVKMVSYHLSLLDQVFTAIDKLANSDPKHYHEFRMKNYHYLYESLQPLVSDPLLIKKLNQANEICEKSKQEYVRWIIREQFGELWTFLEAVEEYVDTRGVDIEDIAYQAQFSKRKLDTLLKKYETTMLIMKDILNMKQRMEKHLGVKPGEHDLSVKYNMFAIVYQYLTNEFKSRYEVFEKNVRRCFHFELQPSLKQMIEAFVDVDKTATGNYRRSIRF